MTQAGTRPQRESILRTANPRSGMMRTSGQPSVMAVPSKLAASLQYLKTDGWPLLGRSWLDEFSLQETHPTTDLLLCWSTGRG
jgi:hypothetical protein